MMTFTLRDADERAFNIERWCFLGSIDRWIILDERALLDQLLARYVEHLGQPSFFEPI